jgi:flagellar hook protein FlgE
MGFQQGLSGLNIASKNLDVIGNNVANASTVGFKVGQAQFADVFAASLSGAGSSPVGLGAKIAGITQQFTQGNITSTNNPLDLAINGGGFFQVTDSGGTPFYTRNGQFQLDKDGFIVNNQGFRLAGYPANDAGLIVTGAQTDIQIDTADIAPVATGTSAGATGLQGVLNLDGRAPIIAATFDAGDPTTYTQSTSLNVYDSQGNAHNYSLYFTKVGASTWEVNATLTSPGGTTTAVTIDTDAGTAGVQAPRIVFDADGQITSGASFTQTIAAATLGGTVDPLSFSVDLTGSTQFGASFSVNSLSQDGFASGKLTGFVISPDGTLLGRYSNGETKNLAQVILASFRNPQGLQPIGNNLWVDSAASGPPLIGTPQSGQYGAIQSSAVEDSNVDLTAELVNMITAQRVYQANAQTIKTQDAVLQTLVNLR